MTLKITYKHPVRGGEVEIDLETAFDMALDNTGADGVAETAQAKADNTAKALGRLVQHLIEMRLLTPEQVYDIADQPQNQNWSDR